MAVESWQIIHIVGVFLGLLVGWRFNPWLGTAFILIFVTVVETLSFNKQRKTGKASAETKHHTPRA